MFLCSIESSIFCEWQDAFRDNFLVEWQPESLLNKIAPSRPRVYLIDFEVAVMFPDDCPPQEHICVGIPTGGSLNDETKYARPVPEEVACYRPYDPFKLDVWQFGESIKNYKVHTVQLT